MYNRKQDKRSCWLEHLIMFVVCLAKSTSQIEVNFFLFSILGVVQSEVEEYKFGRITYFTKLQGIDVWK